MNTASSVDAYKVVHWMNARKLTPAMLAQRTRLAPAVIDGILAGQRVELREETLGDLATGLQVSAGQLTREPDWPDVIYLPASRLWETRRAVQRDGRHFYNYYTLPAPAGSVAPVILDILCPRDRLPTLNAGHLEPAITVNLGPGPIHGRWAEALTPTTWRVLDAASEADSWVVGDSYVEPSYCPHSYSLAGSLPARIVSYTSRSPLAEFLSVSNRWNPQAFGALVDALDSRFPTAVLLRYQLDRRGYTAAECAARANVPVDGLEAYSNGEASALSIEQLQRVAAALGLDYRTLLYPAHVYDPAGKVHCSIADSLATRRQYKSYTIASMAAATNLPDLCGLFIAVDRAPESASLDLQDFAPAHYLVTRGAPGIRWRGMDGAIHEQTLAPMDSVWLAPLTLYGLCGSGALLKLSGGDCCGYLDQLELSNTFEVPRTLARAHRDSIGWGYDTAGG